MINRRELFQRTGLGMGMLGLADIFASERPAIGATANDLSNPLLPKQAHFPGRAKRVVHFFLNGGPSHVDTFDPKPSLAAYAGKPLPQSYLTERKTGGALPSPFKFAKYGQSGIEVSELFSRTAAHIDDIARGHLLAMERGRAGQSYHLAGPAFTLVDALGVRQVLRFTDITWSGSMAAGGDGGVAPAAFTLIATRDADTVRLTGRVRSAQSTRRAAGGYDRAFVQLRAGWQLSGRLAGRAVADTGSGFFETHLR